MDLKVKREFIDWLDYVYLRLSKKSLPPHSLRARVGLIEDFERIPQEFIAYFRLLCGLEMHETILDIGCGPGKFASQLIRLPYLFCGEYHGFDIHKKSIDWALTHITRHNKNFTFKFVDLQNSQYNLDGKLKAETISFPYESEKFDFVFAISVFTHLTPPVTSNYLEEISRVLKPKGKGLLTFFLLDDFPEALGGMVQKELKVFLRSLGVTGQWHHNDRYSIISPSKPEALIAYQRSAVKKMIDQSNLHLEKIYYGSWNRPKDFLSFQDIVIISK